MELFHRQEEGMRQLLGIGGLVLMRSSERRETTDEIQQAR
jgi:hypothetical protein